MTATETNNGTAADVTVATVGIRAALAAIGEDPDREGLTGTPARWVRAFTEMTSGYDVDPAVFLQQRFANPGYEGPIVVAPIPFVSLCEHHLLPFPGTVSVEWRPNPGDPVVGLSKIPRMVLAFAHRLQIQERLTQEILDCLVTSLAPAWAEVTVTATHSCMSMRGVGVDGAMTTTSRWKG